MPLGTFPASSSSSDHPPAYFIGRTTAQPFRAQGYVQYGIHGASPSQGIYAYVPANLPPSSALQVITNGMLMNS